MAQTKTVASEVGTVSWMAPELFKRRAKHTIATDVFAFGMILWELAARRVPWSEDEGANDALIISWVKDGERDDIPEETPSWLKGLIERCWHQDPTQRPRMPEVCKVLSTSNSQSVLTNQRPVRQSREFTSRGVESKPSI